MSDKESGNGGSLATLKRIMLLSIISIIGLSTVSAEPQLDSILNSHRSRVRDFETYLEKRKAGRSNKGADQFSKEREAWQKKSEVARQQFVITRKKIDPLLEEKRDKAYEAEIASREKANEKLRADFVRKRNVNREALAKQKQINETLEFELQDPRELEKESSQ